MESWPGDPCTKPLLGMQVPQNFIRNFSSIQIDTVRTHSTEFYNCYHIKIHINFSFLSHLPP